VDDPDGDPVYYELQLATSADFSEILITQGEIFFGDAVCLPEPTPPRHPGARYSDPEQPNLRSILTFPLSDLGASGDLLNHGMTYFWRVRAYDHFGGSPDFGTDFSQFLLNTPPVSLLPDDAVLLEEDSNGALLENLQESFLDADNDVLTIAPVSWSPGLDSVFVASTGDSSRLVVYLQDRAKGLRL
jgi:hypothetical protein